MIRDSEYLSSVSYLEASDSGCAGSIWGFGRDTVSYTLPCARREHGQLIRMFWRQDRHPIDAWVSDTL